ncbi:MAG: heavy-metal-associated domain-containing protein, partial [Bacteroidota bacterium]
MKRPRQLVLLSLLGMMLYLAGCTAKGNSTSAFWVRGNCEMCKDKIENAFTEMDGIVEASYDLTSNMLTVNYDSTVVKELDLHQACAGVG